MSHSPEPWSIHDFKCNCGQMHSQYVNDASGEMVHLHDHLERIVACVNAMKDVPDPAAFVVEAWRLRAALQAVRDWYFRDGSVGGCDTVIHDQVVPFTKEPA